MSRRALQVVAVGLFAQDGYANTTMTRIAEVAGVGRTTLFRYFATKDEIIRSLAEEPTRRFVAGLRVADPARPVVDCIGAAAAEAQRHPPAENGFARLLWRVVDATPELAASADRTGERWRAAMADFVVSRYDDRVTPFVLDIFVHAVHGVILGAARQWGEAQDQDALLSDYLTSAFATVSASFTHWLEGQLAPER